MNIVIYSFRYGKELFETQSEFKELWKEVIYVLDSISEEDIINSFNNLRRNAKSISESINKLIKERLSALGWKAESAIFQDSRYDDKRFRLDFAKENISIEVAFNHGEAISWNLLKPTLASELNHVKKAIQTKAGIIITTTEALKKEGGFDRAVGTYEKFIRYLEPMNNILTIPMVIIGLKPFGNLEINRDSAGGYIASTRE